MTKQCDFTPDQLLEFAQLKIDIERIFDKYIKKKENEK